MTLCWASRQLNGVKGFPVRRLNDDLVASGINGGLGGRDVLGVRDISIINRRVRELLVAVFGNELDEL